MFWSFSKTEENKGSNLYKGDYSLSYFLHFEVIIQVFEFEYHKWTHTHTHNFIRYNQNLHPKMFSVFDYFWKRQKSTIIISTQNLHRVKKIQRQIKSKEESARILVLT